MWRRFRKKCKTGITVSFTPLAASFSSARIPASSQVNLALSGFSSRCVVLCRTFQIQVAGLELVPSQYEIFIQSAPRDILQKGHLQPKGPVCYPWKWDFSELTQNQKRNRMKPFATHANCAKWREAVRLLTCTISAIRIVLCWCCRKTHFFRLRYQNQTFVTWANPVHVVWEALVMFFSDGCALMRVWDINAMLARGNPTRMIKRRSQHWLVRDRCEFCCRILQDGHRRIFCSKGFDCSVQNFVSSPYAIQTEVRPPFLSHSGHCSNFFAKPISEFLMWCFSKCKNKLFAVGTTEIKKDKLPFLRLSWRQSACRRWPQGMLSWHRKCI